MTATDTGPAMVGRLLAGGRTNAEERAEQDALLRKIEQARNVPDHAWPLIRRRVEELRGTAERIATAYLRCVLSRGAAMFPPVAHAQMSLDPPPDHRRTITCSCGAATPAEDETRLGRRIVFTARCRECSSDVAEFVDETALA